MTDYSGLDLFRDIANEVAVSRAQWRQENHIAEVNPRDIYAVGRERLEENRAVLIRFKHDQKTLGAGILAVLWDTFSNRLWTMEEGYEQARFRFWITEEILEEGEDYDEIRYFMSLVNVVESIFPVVNEQEVAGNPILDEHGEPITVERLITQSGTISKLKEFATRIRNAGLEEQFQLIAQIAGNRSRRDIRRGVQDEERLPLVRLLIHNEADGTITLSGSISPAQLRFLQRQLDGRVDFAFD